MRSLTGIHLILLLFVFSVSAQTAGAKAETALRVEVEDGKTLDLTTADLAKLARREVRAKGHDEKESIYSGYNLSDVLLVAGAKIGKGEMRGRELAAYVVIEAADKYKAAFGVAEIAPEFTDKIILLADARAGKPLAAKEGFWQIVVPDEKKHGRWVQQVVAVKLKKIQ